MVKSAKLSQNKFGQQKLVKTKRRRETLASKRRLADLEGRSRRNDLLPEIQIRMVSLGDLRSSRHHTRRVTPQQLELSVVSTFGTDGCVN